jgi:hypothetical protein
MADAPRITVDELKRRMEAGEDFTLIDVVILRLGRNRTLCCQKRSGYRRTNSKKTFPESLRTTCSGVLHLTRRRL